MGVYASESACLFVAAQIVALVPNNIASSSSLVVAVVGRLTRSLAQLRHVYMGVGLHYSHEGSRINSQPASQRSDLLLRRTTSTCVCVSASFRNHARRPAKSICINVCMCVGGCVAVRHPNATRMPPNKPTHPHVCGALSAPCQRTVPLHVAATKRADSSPSSSATTTTTAAAVVLSPVGSVRNRPQRTHAHTHTLTFTRAWMNY